MSKPANRCGCTHTIYSYQREELAEVAKVCLPYSKTAYDFTCNFANNFACYLSNNFACGFIGEIANKTRNKNKYIYYKYKKIGVV